MFEFAAQRGGVALDAAAIANAVSDALAPFGAEFNATPIKPEQIVEASSDCTSGPAGSGHYTLKAISCCRFAADAARPGWDHGRPPDPDQDRAKIPHLGVFSYINTRSRIL
jgi:hypothetical protein